MAKKTLLGLHTIQGNLAKLVKDKNALREELKQLFQGFLNRGQRKFQDKLNSESVSPHFKNTIASRRLFRAFNTDLNKSLTFGADGGVRFAFKINSTGGSKYTDPAVYFWQINDASRRKGGPNIDRVMEWMKERGIVAKLKSGKGFRKTVTTRNGKQPSVRRLAYVIMRTIWRKNAAKDYKSLKLTKMFADVIDIKNPNSDFRETMRGRVSNLVTKGT
jgi:hypothetical protein